MIYSIFAAFIIDNKEAYQNIHTQDIYALQLRPKYFLGYKRLLKVGKTNSYLFNRIYLKYLFSLLNIFVVDLRIILTSKHLLIKYLIQNKYLENYRKLLKFSLMIEK
jgi:hypothetical protein